MSKSLTICFTTARDHPEIGWFLESLAPQIHHPPPLVDILIIDRLMPEKEVTDRYPVGISHFTAVRPKPTIWQGKYRITKEEWWSAGSARNTGIALCQTDYIAFLDDRCVLAPTWMEAVRDAMDYHYAVVGPYEKRIGMEVQNGVVTSPGTLIGEDDRIKYCKEHYEPKGMKSPWKADRAWWYGCSTALPLQWALEVNGFPEDYCNGTGYEDSPFGVMLHNNGRPFYLDERMKIIEDRTPDKSGPVLRRTDKGISPNDKSHAIQKHFMDAKTSGNSYDLRALRERVLKGEPFPPPTESKIDWYDGQEIAEMT